MMRFFSWWLLLTSFGSIGLVVSLPCTAADAEVSAQQQAAPVILIMGDSLSAGFGIDPRQGWVALLQQRLAQENFPHHVVNASISGETSSGGLSRLASALHAHQPRLVIIELGGNDGLRGLPLDLLRRNLAKMIVMAQKDQARVLLIGMRLPPNYGPRYTDGFTTLYAQLAEKYAVALVPFLLKGVATHPALMQADGIHPVAAAQPALLDNVWPQLLPLLGP